MFGFPDWVVLIFALIGLVAVILAVLGYVRR